MNLRAPRRSSRLSFGGTIVLLATVVALISPAWGIAPIHDLHQEPGSEDARGGGVAPTEQQLQAAADLGASVQWTRFGTPQSVIVHGGYLATGVAGADAVSAARNWLGANLALFRLASTDDLQVVSSGRMPNSSGHGVTFRQTFDGIPAGEDGLVTVGVTGTAASGWKVAYASSSLTGETTLTGSVQLTATEAWLRAAEDVGRAVAAVDVGELGQDREWTTFGVEGFADTQRVRLVAVPTFVDGVRPAYEALVLDNQGGVLSGFVSFVDAETGAVLVRRDVVHESHPAAATFTGQVPAVDAACDVDRGPWVVSSGEDVGSIDVVVEAFLTTNDSVIHLKRDGTTVASQDTLFSPEVIHYSPAGGVAPGAYTVQVCDFPTGGAWAEPRDYQGVITFSPAGTTFPPYPPKWNVFPANPLLHTVFGDPWNHPSTDTRKLWCWDSVVQGTPVAGCDDEVKNTASRVPWDHNVQANAPTFTTTGNNADSGEAWTDPLAPGAFGFRPLSGNRVYSFPWTNAWSQNRCFSEFVPGQSNDIGAAVANLFAMHNRMHDWSYHLGFTEENWNAQLNNFGNGGAERDPVIGDAQAGAVSGGYPLYLGRDNANMRTLPDGVSSITNMYLWQPLRGSFYAPCVDGDFDMSVIAHEYTHMTENRMIGKGGARSGHHAGAMGESTSDLNGVEILNEYGFVPVGDENPFTVGPYVTGNKERGIRNYAMNASPLNLSNLGYDAFNSPPVHADGEIWSATNFDVRQALVDKYNGSYPVSDAALQRRCAEGLTSPDNCPGNRRWIQLVYDSYLLMPTNPSMLVARDAMLAADVMRFGGANQAELWLAFARRGMGAGATSSNGNVASDTDPKPDFRSPLHPHATVTFAVSALDEGNAPVTNARIFVGRYETRSSPIADTNPATNTTGTNNLDDVAQFAPGTYEFLVRAPGHGAMRFTRTLGGGSNVTLNVAMPTNWASSAKGATTSGDGTAAERSNLVDDTEATNWTFTGTPVENRQVTVDLPGTEPRSLSRVQVSAYLNAQNRFTALRQFRMDVSTNGTTFTPAFTSAPDAFPGAAPRPVLPEMLLRSFSLPNPVMATHVRLVVLHTQCTGQPQFHGVQDNDLLNPTDCRGTGEPAGTDPLGLAPAAQANVVRAAEFQVFGSAGGVSDGSTLTLAPKASSNEVGSQHCVTGTLLDASSAPLGGVTVRFSVTGAHGTGGNATTGANGQAQFCYPGTVVGNDAIAAFADLDGNGTQGFGEPGDDASKTWLERSTPSCEVKVTSGGHIVTDAGDKATFGGNAKVTDTGVPKGNQTYQDHGPADPMNVKSINVLSIVCPSENAARISGLATIDGSDEVAYQIDLVDAGEPGTSDMYRIQLTVGPTVVYDSGSHTMEGGNVQIHQ